MDQNSGKAVIENGYIVIRLSIDALQYVIDGNPDRGTFPRILVTDGNSFASELVQELNRESENGSTRIHRMMDSAIEYAFEQGAEGVEERRECNGCNGTGEVPMMIAKDGSLDFISGERVGNMKCEMCDGEGYRD